VNWDADFAGMPPIALPDGRKLETLADLRGYILALAKQERLGWNDAVAALLKAAEHGGPFRFIARVAFSRTLHGMSGVGPIPKAPDKNAAKDLPYESGRSKRWLKIKNPDSPAMKRLQPLCCA
jgi:hypothetical protein